MEKKLSRQQTEIFFLIFPWKQALEIQNKKNITNLSVDLAQSGIG